MDGATGIITLASPLDYSQQAYYSLIAEASDPDGKTDTANVGVDEHVQTFFVRANSYLNAGKRNWEARRELVLSHEQGHFDIAELFARALRHELRSLAATMTTTAAVDLPNVRTRIETQLSHRLADFAARRIQEFYDTMQNTQRLYDRQAGSPDRVQANERWRAFLDEALAEGDEVNPFNILRAMRARNPGGN